MPPEGLDTCSSRYTSSGASRLSVGRAPGRGASDLTAKLRRHSQPWSFDIWSLGAILLELSVGTPLWLSYKCRVADDNRPNGAAVGLFAVPGREAEKILQRQSDALQQKGLRRILRDPAGVRLDDDGLDFL